MPTLSTDLRNKLERTCIAARNLAEKAARAALEAIAVQAPGAYAHMTREQKDLRNKLRARGRQLGDVQDTKDNLAIEHLSQECGYEHWHRMLFARFLAENSLLIPPDLGTPVTLEECKELAKDEKTNLWAFAGRCAQTMLPEIFRADDPVLQVPTAREDQLKLEQLLDGLTTDVFTASDSLGWCYQFWQSERKDAVNESGNKIGADELPSVTQLFTEDYMVDFLLDNTLGAWWAGKVSGVGFQVSGEEEARRKCALPGCPWKYLRFVKGKDGKWTPAAGTFEGWPKTAKELKCLDPCMGSGHFVVAMFERLVALRMAEERLREKDAVAAVIRDNLFGLEIDPRCTQIAAFNLALAAWRRVGHCPLPAMNLACSGLAPNAKKEDWLKLAGKSERHQRGMERLYQLFEKAPILGSLIDPRTGESDLLVAAFHELQPLLERALTQASGDETTHEMAVTARGVAQAAAILASEFSLVGTNVPYLGMRKQDEALRDFCDRWHRAARADLATCFIERCLAFCCSGGSAALVTPQNWLFLTTYKTLRERLLNHHQWDAVGRLGARAFEMIGGEVVNVALVALTKHAPPQGHVYVGLDAATQAGPAEKSRALIDAPISWEDQQSQLNNPDARIVIGGVQSEKLLSDYAFSAQGIGTTDNPRFVQCCWEQPAVAGEWETFQSGATSVAPVGGCSTLLRWGGPGGPYFRHIEALRKENRIGGGWQAGGLAWGQSGFAVNVTGTKFVSWFSTGKFDTTIGVIVPNNRAHAAAILCYLHSARYTDDLIEIDPTLSVTEGTLIKVPFDLGHWRQVAEKKYPHGLPKPFSSDPTQWLFDGHPKGSDNPLHVAVARLLGYQWPRQTGSNFPDCPALKPDGLEKLADDDGIVCIPSVHGEEPASERLRKLLVAAYGKDWKPASERELIRATGSKADDLDEWLRSDFFEQHCDLFHGRPFLWHIWDGRKRDGFHVIVNYHKLADGAKGRRLLEKLTHTYLNEWISRQKDGVKRGDDGAEERLAAALELKQRLEGILEGEPPFDIFVRWKPLAEQAIGWEPDINDGVRMNIRPFLADDLPAGKKGAGVLRVKPGIKWDKDRGKEPHRDKKAFPWFWVDGEFTGDRVNDVHLTNEQKRKARG